MASGSSSRGGVAIRLLLIVVAALVLFALVAYYNKQRQLRPQGPPERFSAAQPSAYGAPLQLGDDGPTAGAGAAAGAGPALPAGAAPQAFGGGSAAAAFAAPSPLESTATERLRPVPGGDPFTASVTSPRDPFPQDRITPEQLLPKDAANSKWAQANPAGQGDIADQNLLTAGYHMGTDTQGNSLRNASHDIRSTPPNPRYRVSIWNQSNIEPDMSRRPLE